MWAVLWNLWLLNKDVKINKELDFSFATSSINEWYLKKIFHNAGAVDSNKFFIKSQFISSTPFNKELKADKNYCSFKYIQEIQNCFKNNQICLI
jgi:hypothetical protein